MNKIDVNMNKIEFENELSKIDWLNVYHLLGKIRDIQNLLLDLISPDLEVQKKAIDFFRKNTFQEIVVPTSPKVIPFLLSILLLEECFVKKEVSSLTFPFEIVPKMFEFPFNFKKPGNSIKYILFIKTKDILRYIDLFTVDRNSNDDIKAIEFFKT